jgi:hypothetical protein
MPKFVCPTMDQAVGFVNGIIDFVFQDCLINFLYFIFSIKLPQGWRKITECNPLAVAHCGVPKRKQATPKE